MTEFPRSLKHITIWLVLGTAVFLGVQAWQAAQQASRIQIDDRSIALRRSADGHFHWTGTIDGRPVSFLVDTGATRTALPLALAEQLGLQPEARVQSQTAGGVVQGWQARADVRLDGGVRAERLLVTVLPQLGAPLLGMDVLSRLRFTQTDGVLRLERPAP